MQIRPNRTIMFALFLLATITSSFLFVSCQDDYVYEKKEPGFLGESIYSYLEEDGNFTYFLKLIDDLGYKDVLSKTGSKTLFPVRDKAFEDFFKGNEYGVTNYNQLSFAQKRSIMNVSMVNMAYLSYMLSNTVGSGGNPGEGLALRHNTANTYLDSINFMKDEVLFENPYWNRFSQKGVYVLEDESPASIVHFTPAQMSTHGVTGADFSKLFNGVVYTNGDIYINGIRIEERDIICKNGYVHVLEKLMLPAKNMAQIIRDNGDTDLFNKLMNKFCAPYYSIDLTNKVKEFYDGSMAGRPILPGADSVFVKRYFSSYLQYDPNGKIITSYGVLHYDPSENKYAYQSDMATMFVPTDDAMNNYINSDKGRYLKDAYGSWENIPTPLLALFLKNHQIKSFTASLPHSWPTLTDESSNLMNVNANDIKKTYIGNNGAVYISDKVYPPVDYQCVYGSVLINNDTKIMNWAIQDKSMKFYLYLRSMENMYNLIIPVDDAFDNYRDPVAWGNNVNSREIWSFKYNPSLDIVYADVYSVDSNGEKSILLKQITDISIIRNRLNDIVDMHIVVGEKKGGAMSGYIDDGKTKFALTKSGTTLKVSDSGSNVKITGGGDIEEGKEPAQVIINPITGEKSRYDSDNGRTFFIDKILQDPSKSVYKTLGEHNQYTFFFDLLKGDERVYSYFQNQGDKDITAIFDLKKTSSYTGLGYVVNSFNNFRYTVFVPTEQALRNAFASDEKLFTWDEIHAEEDHDKKKEKALYLLRFLKYHFMDNSIYISGETFNGMIYETAARSESTKFHRLMLSSNGNNLEIQCEGQDNTGQPVKANVIKTEGLFNLMARDYIISTASPASIAASSNSVIHLIDNALKFE